MTQHQIFTKSRKENNNKNGIGLILVYRYYTIEWISFLDFPVATHLAYLFATHSNAILFMLSSSKSNGFLMLLKINSFLFSHKFQNVQ